MSPDDNITGTLPAQPLTTRGDGVGALSPGVTSAAKAAAAAWAAAMQERRKPCRMPPWDEAPWFLNPTTTLSLLPPGGAPVQLCASNPSRVGLIISNGSTVYDAFVTPDPSASALSFKGIHLAISYPFINILQSEWGPMASLAWWGSSNPTGPATTPITVVELVLRDWPGNS